MGKLFDRPNLKVPIGLFHFELLEFDQMESANSGRSDDEDEDRNDDPEMQIRPWIPSKTFIILFILKYFWRHFGCAPFGYLYFSFLNVIANLAYIPSSIRWQDSNLQPLGC